MQSDPGISHRGRCRNRRRQVVVQQTSVQHYPQRYWQTSTLSMHLMIRTHLLIRTRLCEHQMWECATVDHQHRYTWATMKVECIWCYCHRKYLIRERRIQIKLGPICISVNHTAGSWEMCQWWCLRIPVIQVNPSPLPSTFHVQTLYTKIEL